MLVLRRRRPQAHVYHLIVQRRVLFGVLHTLIIDIDRYHVLRPETLGEDRQHPGACTMVEDIFAGQIRSE